MAVNSDGEQVYCWQRGDGQWRVGTVARDVKGKLIQDAEWLLMRVFEELEWVPLEMLTPYPLEPIPEPEVRS